MRKLSWGHVCPDMGFPFGKCNEGILSFSRRRDWKSGGLIALPFTKSFVLAPDSFQRRSTRNCSPPMRSDVLAASYFSARVGSDEFSKGLVPESPRRKSSVCSHFVLPVLGTPTSTLTPSSNSSASVDPFHSLRSTRRTERNGPLIRSVLLKDALLLPSQTWSR